MKSVGRLRRSEVGSLSGRKRREPPGGGRALEEWAMKLITVQKDPEEIDGLLGDASAVFLAGCGTCATLCRTGGVAEVLAMKERLEKGGRKITGWTVIPIACDDLSREAIQENAKAVDAAEAILVMACAFGVQMISECSGKPTLPALNTMFVGKESGGGVYREICAQCGDCVIGKTAGICPITRCAKGLLNGPCGGTNHGKCEVDSSVDCAWTLIYRRLEELGRLELMEEILPPKDYAKASAPRRFDLSELLASDSGERSDEEMVVR